MKVVADLGGTHSRFGLLKNGELIEGSVRKYVSIKFSTPNEALSAYCRELGIEFGVTLLIATAGTYNPQSKVWEYVNEENEELHSWKLSIDSLENDGHSVSLILNDFEAATWGMSTLSAQHIIELKPTDHDMPKYPKCLTGPGTGLGIAFLEVNERDELSVKKTFGGHKLATPATEEHWQIIKNIKANKAIVGDVVDEDLISGQGLFDIYQAYCRLNNKEQSFQTKNEMFNRLESVELKEALRLFHEFFGTYLSTLFIPNHTEGGFYLVGGVTDTLMQKNLLDTDTLITFMIPDVVEPVKKVLQKIGVSYIADEYIPLKGLVVAEENNVKTVFNS